MSEYFNYKNQYFSLRGGVGFDFEMGSGDILCYTQQILTLYIRLFVLSSDSKRDGKDLT